MSGGLTVLVVDDSAFARSTVSRRLLDDPEVARVEIARDGIEAVEKTLALKPDVVTMDVQMPRLDGIGALEKIMRDAPTPVVMLSSLTGDDTDTTVRALELGAVDFFLKPSLSNVAGVDSERDLLSIVKMAARVPVARLARAARRSQAVKLPASPPAKRATAGPRGGKPEMLVVIASSTGGPKALAEVVPRLPADLPIAYLLVQHMPAGFTRSLAERLNNSSQISVKEAAKGDRISAGQALMAPGGYHMVLASNGEIDLLTTPQEHGVRPAADVTLKSAARSYGSKTVVAVLTGMGRDGRDGAGAVKAAGGFVIAEHESTCAVYGMPRAVVDAGYADKVVPVHRVAREIVRRVEAGLSSGAGAAD